MEVLEELIDSYPFGTTEGFKGKLALHYGCEQGLSYRHIKCLLKHNEESIKQTGGEHLTLPLSYALMNSRPSIEVIRLLVSEYPAAVTTYDMSNRLPLHYALEHAVSSDIIFLLIDSNPDTIRAQGRGSSNIPLHISIDKHAPKEVILKLIEMYPQGAAINDIFSISPLRKAILNQLCNEIILALLDACPTAASMIDEHDRMPIHYALSRRASVEVVDALIRACPDSIKVTDDNGQLPLHLCVKRGGPIDNLTSTLKAFPEGVHCFDNYKLTPLHHSICEVDVNVDVVSAIVKSDRTTASTSLDGKLPIHLAIDYKRPIEIVKVLLKAYKEGAKVKDQKYGRIPLVLAVRRVMPIEYLTLLEEAYTLEDGCCKEKDGINGSILIHYALKYRAPFKFFLRVLSFYPGIVHDIDLPAYDTLSHSRDQKVCGKATDNGGTSISSTSARSAGSSTVGNHCVDDDDDDVNQEIKIVYKDIKRTIGKQLIHYAVEDVNASTEVITEIMLHTMPYRPTGEYNPLHNFTWTYLLSATEDRYEQSIAQILDRYDGSIDVMRLLTDVPNEEGVRSRDCASPLCLKQLLRRLYFYDRYEWLERPIVHTSSNSLIRLAAGIQHIHAHTHAPIYTH